MHLNTQKTERPDAARQPDLQRIRKPAPRETREIKAPGQIGPGLVLLSVLALLGLGGAALTGGPHIQTLGPLLGAVGLSGGDLLVAGTVLSGVWLILARQRKLTHAVLRANRAGHTLDELRSEVELLRGTLHLLRQDQSTLHAGVRATRAEIAAQTRGDRTAEARDAMLGLAGSLDSLHANLGGSITQTRDGLQESLRKISALIESSRDSLQGSMENEMRSVARLDSPAENRGPNGLSDHQPNEYFEQPAPRASGTDIDWNSHLEILVELEEDPEYPGQEALSSELKIDVENPANGTLDHHSNSKAPELESFSAPHPAGPTSAGSAGCVKGPTHSPMDERDLPPSSDAAETGPGSAPREQESDPESTAQARTWRMDTQGPDPSGPGASREA